MKLYDTLVKLSTTSHTKATIYALPLIIATYVNILPLTFSFRCLRHKITLTIMIITDASTTRITIIMIIIIVTSVSSELIVCSELDVVLIVVGIGTVTSKIICHSNNTSMKFVYLICKHEAPKQNAYKSNTN